MALAQTILEFAAIVAVGALLRWVGLLKPEDARPLNAVIIYAGLPAFIFRALHGAKLGPDLWRLVALAWGVFAVMLALGWLGARLLRLGREQAGGFMLATALGNTGYIGYPVTAALLGASAVPLAVFSDVFGTVVALVAVGLPLAAELGRHDEGRINPLREILTFPAFIAAVVGIALRPVAIPIPVSAGLDLLASLVAPLIMISVGLALRPRSLARNAGALGVLGMLRLVVAPLLALLAGGLFLHGPALQVAVLEAGVPSMMLTLAVGQRFGLDTDFIASAIFVTTVAAALTIPVMQLLAF